MTPPTNCIACGAEPYFETRNGLAMNVCAMCKLFWRREFDVAIEYYEEKDILLDTKKLEARIRNVKDRVAMIRSVVAPEDVCDVGCGEGLFLRELERQGVKHVIGMEPGAEGANYARSLGLTVSNESIENVEAVAQEHKPISMFTLFHVIEHLPNPAESVRLLKAALPAGGTVVFETPDFQSVSFVQRGYRHKLVYPEHLFYWNSHALRLFLEKEGFEVIEDTHRDFDKFRLEPLEALRRLGILSYPKPKSDTFVVKGGGSTEAHMYQQVSVKTTAKLLLGYVLNYIVQLTKRGEYTLMIVRVKSAS